jgi:RNA recognition motif-containing protein
VNKKLYVGNLSYNMTEDELWQMFTEVGTVVSVTLITDRTTGQSKGFGFVEMESEKAAQDAIARLNNTEVHERTITVSEARPPRERSFDDGGRRGSRGGRPGSSSRGGDRDRDRRRY